MQSNLYSAPPTRPPLTLPNPHSRLILLVRRSDGEWEATWQYWNSTEFLAWLANEGPTKDTIVWNDRWGGGADDCLCHHGSYYTCADRFLPSSLVGHAWENAFTIDTVSWGYRRNAVLADYMTTEQVVETVVQTVALGGNALINIGPARDGSIDTIFADRLMGLGAWLGVNGEAIYATRPWAVAQNDTAAAAWYTSTPSALYAIVTAWPAASKLTLVAPTGAPGVTVATLLGGDGSSLPWAPLNVSGKPGIVVTLPGVTPGSALATAPAWTIKLVGAS